MKIYIEEDKMFIDFEGETVSVDIPEDTYITDFFERGVWLKNGHFKSEKSEFSCGTLENLKEPGEVF